jgi:Ran GTPase-activating protein (RanGAP) involved in mRNA processing and transport
MCNVNNYKHLPNHPSKLTNPTNHPKPMDANEHDEQGFFNEDDDDDGNFIVDEEAAQLLRQLEQNDPDLLEIHVGDDFPDGPNLDWQWFGAMLGRNSHLNELSVDLFHINDNERQFIQGLSLNRSIENVHLYSYSRERSEKVDWFMPFLQNNQVIKTLHISNPIGVNGFRALNDILLNPNCNLTALGLQDTGIDDERANILSFGLNGNETLKRLNLSWNQDITEHGFQALVDTFLNPGFRVEKLIIEQCVMSDANALSLSTVLRLNTTIKSLILTQTEIATIAGWQDLFVGIMQSPDCTLESLMIISDTTGLNLEFGGTRMNDEIVQSLTDSLAVNGSLMELALRYNQGVTTAGWESFCVGLQNPISILKKLDLSSNSINDQVINSLVESIMTDNITLQELNLSSNNDVTAMGWETLCAVLQSPNSSIEVLCLNDNSFNDQTLAAYVDALMGNSNLRELQLRNNRHVTAAGWDTFSTVLRNPTLVLEEFHLGNNILNDLVIISFVDALAQNNKLRVLDLSDVDGLTELGWNALNNLLFNQSSIDGAYNSNHTLEELWAWPHRREFLPEYIVILLEINRDNSVSRAQWTKIRLYTRLNHNHGNNIDIQLFTGMHLSLLTYAMAWMGKDEPTVGTNLLFRLVRSVPTLFEQGNN